MVNLWYSNKNWMGPNPNGPRSASCDRAIRYSDSFPAPFVVGPFVGDFNRRYVDMSNDFHMPNLQQNIISDDSPPPSKSWRFKDRYWPYCHTQSIQHHETPRRCSVRSTRESEDEQEPRQHPKLTCKQNIPRNVPFSNRSPYYSPTIVKQPWCVTHC